MNNPVVVVKDSSSNELVMVARLDKIYPKGPFVSLRDLSRDFGIPVDHLVWVLSHDQNNEHALRNMCIPLANYKRQQSNKSYLAYQIDLEDDDLYSMAIKYPKASYARIMLEQLDAAGHNKPLINPQLLKRPVVLMRIRPTKPDDGDGNEARPVFEWNIKKASKKRHKIISLSLKVPKKARTVMKDIKKQLNGHGSGQDLRTYRRNLIADMKINKSKLRPYSGGNWTIGIKDQIAELEYWQYLYNRELARNADELAPMNTLYNAVNILLTNPRSRVYKHIYWKRIRANKDKYQVLKKIIGDQKLPEEFDAQDLEETDEFREEVPSTYQLTLLQDVDFPVRFDQEPDSWWAKLINKIPDSEKTNALFEMHEMLSDVVTPANKCMLENPLPTSMKVYDPKSQTTCDLYEKVEEAVNDLLHMITDDAFFQLVKEYFNKWRLYDADSDLVSDIAQTLTETLRFISKTPFAEKAENISDQIIRHVGQAPNEELDKAIKEYEGDKTSNFLQLDTFFEEVSKKPDASEQEDLFSFVANAASTSKNVIFNTPGPAGLVCAAADVIGYATVARLLQKGGIENLKIANLRLGRAYRALVKATGLNQEELTKFTKLLQIGKVEEFRKNVSFSSNVMASRSWASFLAVVNVVILVNLIRADDSVEMTLDRIGAYASAGSGVLCSTLKMVVVWTRVGSMFNGMAPSIVASLNNAVTCVGTAITIVGSMYAAVEAHREGHLLALEMAEDQVISGSLSLVGYMLWAVCPVLGGSMMVVGAIIGLMSGLKSMRSYTRTEQLMIGVIEKYHQERKINAEPNHPKVQKLLVPGDKWEYARRHFARTYYYGVNFCDETKHEGLVIPPLEKLLDTHIDKNYLFSDKVKDEHIHSHKLDPDAAYHLKQMGFDSTAIADMLGLKGKEHENRKTINHYAFSYEKRMIAKESR